MHSKIEYIKDAALVYSAILLIDQDDQLYIMSSDGRIKEAQRHTLRDGSKIAKVTKMWTQTKPLSHRITP
jgi:hypothetical protein